MPKPIHNLQFHPSATLSGYSRSRRNKLSMCVYSYQWTGTSLVGCSMITSEQPG